MKKTIYILLILVSAGTSIRAQHSFAFGSSTMELGGYFIGYYENRPKYAGDPKAGDYHHNTFILDDARLSIKGWAKGNFRYHVEVNMAALIIIATSPPGPTGNYKDNPLTEGHVTWVNPWVNIKVGYMKVPFGASSILDKLYSPSLARTVFANSDYFSRRDAGFLLYKDFWHQRITIYAGMFSGIGEGIILGAGDPNGKPEYAGRVELSTSYWRDDELDRNDLPIPVLRVSGNVRYTEKTQWAGGGETGFALDNVKTVNGSKLSWGYDAGFKWHGFTAQFELDAANISPAKSDPEYAVLSEFNTKMFRDGGWLLQGNYYNKRIMSAFFVRYDQWTGFDLYTDQAQKTITYGYNFIYKPYNLTLKIDYAYRLKQTNINAKWGEDQLRAGVQYVF